MQVTFPTKPHPTAVSAKYSLIDTNEVIANMKDLGYQVADARYPNFRSKSGEYGFHMVDFRQPKHMKMKTGEAPRLVFLNSYNGTKRAQIHAGIIRFLCMNGLVSGDLVASDKITHIGDAYFDLIERVKIAAVETEILMDRMTSLRGLVLSPVQIREYTRQAVALKYEDPDIVDAAQFAMPRRFEDKGSDMWTIFNRVQENLIKGGIPLLRADGRRIVTQGIRNPQRDVQINRDLWDLTEVFAAELV
ncbi:MAG: DUF932 domain-containing protein [Deltaproteobacteria bacterium]|nr:DUF932 domain-containing protein [Deltaproteobacteria bacterium]